VKRIGLADFACLDPRQLAYCGSNGRPIAPGWARQADLAKAGGKKDKSPTILRNAVIGGVENTPCHSISHGFKTGHKPLPQWQMHETRDIF
jgi:hypothetical protein